MAGADQCGLPDGREFLGQFDELASLFSRIFAEY